MSSAFSGAGPGAPRPGLYLGTVGHRRRVPPLNRFHYPIFQAFLDLDQLDEQLAVSRLVSRNRFNWATFRDSDFLPEYPGATLRQRLAAAAGAAGHTLPGGRVFMLGNLRYLGVAFNPATYYFAYETDGRLALICAEGSNIPWGERHCYWMVPDPGGRAEGGWQFELPKGFHVSPFLPMDLRYHWCFSAPGAQLAIHLALQRRGETIFEVSQNLLWRPWTAGEIRRTLLRFPWTTLKVILAIHWEALRLWLRRAPVFTHPAGSGSFGG